LQKVSKNLPNLVILIEICATIWSSSYTAVAADVENTVDDTSAGKIRGVLNENCKVVAYLGIPYAEPMKRFEQPRPLLGRSGSGGDATMAFRSSPPACVQPVARPEFSHPFLPPGNSEFSEDCLRINVFKPAVDTKPNKRRPILVWVPGEGYGSLSWQMLELLSEILRVLLLEGDFLEQWQYLLCSQWIHSTSNQYNSH